MDKWYINKNALLLSLSAFFADLGYQAVLTGFPIYMFFYLKAPIYVLGLTYAIVYGGGALFGFFGGLLGDKFGKKRIAILGNLFIPILSFCAFSTNVFLTVLLFSLGWWARNLRTPSRRGMLSEVVAENQTSRAFGLLHFLDILGAALAALYFIIFLYFKVQIKYIFLIGVVPLLISTLCIVFVKYSENILIFKKETPAPKIYEQKSDEMQKTSKNVMWGILIGTTLFGFSYYSLGYPIITLAQLSGKDVTGAFSYFIYLFISGITGYIVGYFAGKFNKIKFLGLAGYILSGFGSIIIGIGYLYHLNIIFPFIGVAVLGLGLGVIETLEPSIISLISSKKTIARQMGKLTAARSIGLFIGNLAMSLFYTANPAFSYEYAFFVSIIAGGIILYFGRKANVLANLRL